MMMEMAQFTVLSALRAVTFACAIMVLPPLLVSWWYDHLVLAYVMSFVLMLSMWFALGAFSVVQRLNWLIGQLGVWWWPALLWVWSSLLMVLPLRLALPEAWFADLWFETVSGLTTTGAEVWIDLDQLPISVVLYRHWLQWLGGMGILVWLMSMLAQEGNGMRQIQIDLPGYQRQRLAVPHMRTALRMMVALYISLTILAVLILFLAGVSWFDACCLVFSAVSTGGFAVVGGARHALQSPWICVGLLLVMVCSSLSYALVHACWVHRRISPLWQDQETRGWLKWLVSLLVVVIVYYGWYDRGQLMQMCWLVVTMVTTCGMAHPGGGVIAGPGLMVMLMVPMGLIGGCGMSTAGGIKMYRWQAFWTRTCAEIKALRYPGMVVGHDLPPGQMRAILAYLHAMVLSFLVFVIGFLGMGVSMDVAVTTVLACLTNTGLPWHGDVVVYTTLTDLGKYWLSLVMLVGRVEIVAMLSLVTRFID